MIKHLLFWLLTISFFGFTACTNQQSSETNIPMQKEVQVYFQDSIPKIVWEYPQGDSSQIKVSHYYHNQKLKMQGYLKSGVRNGKWIAWDEEGAMLSMGHYKDGFEDEFIFLDSVDDESLGNKNSGFYLLSPKSKHSLNSQFKRETKLYIHPKALFVNGDKIKASSKFGNYIFEIQTDENLREDCILIYSGTKGVNHLTQFKKSDDGFGAIFQEVKVKLEKI